MKKTFDPNIGRGTRWKKGQPSPNPAGRPKQTLLTAAYRDVLSHPFPGDKQGRTFAERIALEMATNAANGDLRAALELADRTEGKVRNAEDSPLVREAVRDAIRGGPVPLPDRASAIEKLNILADKLRQRIAIRRALAGESGCGTEGASEAI